MSYFWIVDIIGIVACSISGYLVATKKGLDILGIFVLAFATSLGGGIIRDTVVNTIPFAFKESYPFLSVLGGLLFSFIFQLHKKENLEDRFLFVVIDGIGLISFSIAGALVGVKFGLNIFGVATLSFITAVGGGILRDILINEVPFILVSEFYATIAIINGICIFLLNYFEILNLSFMVLVFFVSLFIRIIAFKLDWHLPKLK